MKIKANLSPVAFPPMPTAIDPLITEALDPGEKVLWSGYPRQGFLFHKRDLWWVALALFLGWLASFLLKTWPVPGAPGSHDSFLRSLVPLAPFYAIFIPFMVRYADRARRREATYAITDRRVLIIRTPLFNRTTKSIYLRTLTEVTMTENGDGSGIIFLGSEQTGIRGWLGEIRHDAPCLNTIPEAREVYATVRRALEAA